MKTRSSVTCNQEIEHNGKTSDKGHFPAMLEGTISGLMSWVNSSSHFWHLPSTKTSTPRLGQEDGDIRRGRLTQDAGPGLHGNNFDSCSHFCLWTKCISWAPSFAVFKNQPSCWVCSQLPTSSTPRLPWWISPLQGSNWMALRDFALEERNFSTLQAIANIIK